ncbi:MAG: OsmC family protein [Chloroflexi bacterium]|nr:OsmC family protein [Chloroflexota bacterium]
MADHTAKIAWKESMTFDAVSDEKTHLNFPLSSSHFDEAEGDKGLSPMGLVLVGLAGCTGMDVVSILRKKRQEISFFEIEVEGDQDDSHPRVYRNVTIVYRIAGPDLDEQAVARAIELSMTKYCPVSGMLREVGEINYRYEMVNAD